MYSCKLYKVNQFGFSLIEMLITMAIISILLMIAYPSYHTYLIQSRRDEAKIGLLQLASKLENYATINNTYQGATLEEVSMPTETSDHSYQFIIADLNATTYHIQAVPEGSQNDDTICGSLILDEVGNKTITGKGPVSQCW